MSGRIVSVKAEVEEAAAALAGTKKSLRSIRRSALSISARAVVKAVKSGIRATTERRTGELLKAYRYKVNRDASSATVFPKALNGEESIYPKVMSLSYGRERRPLKALGFVQKGFDAAEGDGVEKEIEKMVDKELKKCWG